MLCVTRYSVRVDGWRYTCWFGFDGARVVPVVTDILGRELYDHRGEYLVTHNMHSPT